jgi:hypothetical protein
LLLQYSDWSNIHQGPFAFHQDHFPLGGRAYYPEQPA